MSTFFFSVVGCAKMELSDEYWVQYAWTSSAAQIGCTTNSNSWRLTCKDNEWVGERGNCTEQQGLSNLVLESKNQIQTWLMAVLAYSWVSRSNTHVEGDQGLCKNRTKGHKYGEGTRLVLMNADADLSCFESGAGLRTFPSAHRGQADHTQNKTTCTHYSPFYAVVFIADTFDTCLVLDLSS
jgi:hypothetical protein